MLARHIKDKNRGQKKKQVAECGAWVLGAACVPVCVGECVCARAQRGESEEAVVTRPNARDTRTFSLVKHLLCGGFSGGTHSHTPLESVKQAARFSFDVHTSCPVPPAILPPAILEGL